MPLLSIVIAARDVEPFIETCLRSLTRSSADLEVLVIDDGSVDGTGRLANEAAQQDARIRVLRNEVAIGPGLSRNRGVDEARGTYVWFVDGDDWVPDGAMDKVFTALEADPDVVVLDFVRSYPSGRTAPSAYKSLLEQAPARPFRLEEWPELVNVLTLACNKVTHRRLLGRKGVRFSDAPVYEDVTFTYDLLLAAQRIVVSPWPCYVYRTGRPGALTRRVGRQHGVWADQWEHVLSSASHAPHVVRLGLFRRMIWHGWGIFSVSNGWRIPASGRRAFFHRFSRLYTRHRSIAGAPFDFVLWLGCWPVGEARAVVTAGVRVCRLFFRQATRTLVTASYRRDRPPAQASR